VTRASTATYVDAAGRIRTAAVNKPRYTFNPETGERLGLLVEEQRTNLVSWSEDFSQSFWVKSFDSAIESNAVLAPDGTLTADKHYNTNTFPGGSFFIRAVLTGALDNTNYSTSVFLKKGRQPLARVLIFGKSFLTDDSYLTYTIDFDNESVAVGVFGAGNATHISSKLEKYNNGWFRFSCVNNLGSGSDPFIDFQSSIWLIPTAVGSEFGYIWGAQIEQASTPSSYIPTQASAVTRAADNVSRVLGGEFNPSEMTVYTHIKGGYTPPSFCTLLVLSKSNTSFNADRIIINLATTGWIRLEGSNIVSSAIVTPTSFFQSNEEIKYALTLGNNTIKLFVNGSQIGTSVALKDASDLVFVRPCGGAWENSLIPSRLNTKDFRYYPKALPESECLALTKL
ncbi:phage head spike fiber domain-containing protein, partial [Limnospira platensis CENA597]